MELNLRQDTGTWWDFDLDEKSPPEIRARFLVVRQTPEIKGKAADEALQTFQVNGQYRRQAPTQKMKPGVYQQSIFRQCCKGWENLNDVSPPEGTGEPIPYNADTLMAMSIQYDGAVQFINDLSEMMATQTIQRIQEERERFRSLLPLPGGSSSPGLLPVRETEEPRGSS